MEHAVIQNRAAARRIVRAVLARDMACAEQALRDEGVTITTATEQPGQRRFPRRGKALTVVTLGAGIVACGAPERIEWLRANLEHLDRDEIFSAATICRLAHFVEPDKQTLGGPDLKYVCSAADLRSGSVPDGIDIATLEEKAIPDLYRFPGFRNALAYRRETSRPDVLATVATRGGDVVGIAGASADCDEMWQIGVDVVAGERGRGIGRALVGQLTHEVLGRGRLPYYSTHVANLRSRTLAVSLGYWPAWVELGTRTPTNLINAVIDDGAEASHAPTLSDGTIVLGGYNLDDVAAHLAGEDEEQARRFGWYPNRSTPETVRQFIIQGQRDWQTGYARRAFAIRFASTSTLVGGCEIRLRDEGCAEMSYWTFPAYRRRGLAARAVRLACDYAFEALGVERMELYIEPDNHASRGVAHRAGFRQEGLLRRRGRFGSERRDFVLYARLAIDPVD